MNPSPDARAVAPVESGSMADLYMFADEAGDANFSRNPGASEYYILTIATLHHCDVGERLLTLRRDLGWQGVHLDRVFHASEDPQAVRDRVFDILSDAEFRVDALVLEKCKAEPHLRDLPALYKMAWYLLFKYVAPRVATKEDRLFVAAASLGTRAERAAFHQAIDDVVEQASPCRSHRVAFWPSESDPCLQVADYCTWAIQRKWERSDSRSYNLIEDKIRSEYPAWRWGSKKY